MVKISEVSLVNKDGKLEFEPSFVLLDSFKKDTSVDGYLRIGKTDPNSKQKERGL